MVSEEELERLVREGILTEEEADALRERLEELGSIARDWDDTRAWQELEYLTYVYDMEETCERMSREFCRSVWRYVQENQGRIWYDEKTRRWRDLEGRFAKNPYVLRTEIPLKW